MAYNTARIYADCIAEENFHVSAILSESKKLSSGQMCELTLCLRFPAAIALKLKFDG